MRQIRRFLSNNVKVFTDGQYNEYALSIVTFDMAGSIPECFSIVPFEKEEACVTYLDYPIEIYADGTRITTNIKFIDF